MIPLCFTKAVFQSRRLARRRPTSALRGLLSSRAVCQGSPARAGSQRPHGRGLLAGCVLAVGRQKADHDTLAHLAEILQRRLALDRRRRAAGRAEDRRRACPPRRPPARGRVADDVCVCVPAGLPLPECSVYCYPSDWPADEDDDEDRKAIASDASRPARGDGAAFRAAAAALEAVDRRGGGVAGLAAAGAAVGGGGHRDQGHLAAARCSSASGGAGWGARSS